MVDITRETYRRLMAEIEELEERVADLEQESEAVRASPNPEDAKTVIEELRHLQERLAAKRNELHRLSDGCGKPHAR